MLEDVILYAFQQCVYYVSKVSPSSWGQGCGRVRRLGSARWGVSGSLGGATCFFYSSPQDLEL